MSQSRLITASLPTSRRCISSASRSSVPPSTERRAERTWTTDGRASSESTGVGVLETEAAAHQLGQRAVAAVAQDREVVGLVLVGQVGDRRVLRRPPCLDTVARAVRHQREVAGLELEALTLDGELAPTGGERVEPDAVRHRRQRAAPWLPQERRAVEDAGDGDVADGPGDRRDRWSAGDVRDHGGTGDGRNHGSIHEAMMPGHHRFAVVMDDQHRTTDASAWKRRSDAAEAGRHEPSPDHPTAHLVHPDPAMIRRTLERRSIATLATVSATGRPARRDRALPVRRRRALRQHRARAAARPATSPTAGTPRSRSPCGACRSAHRPASSSRRRLSCRHRRPRDRQLASAGRLRRSRRTASWTSPTAASCASRRRPRPTYGLGMSLLHLLRNPLEAAAEVEAAPLRPIGHRLEYSGGR